MPPKNTQDRIDQRTYIPPAIEQAMSTHLQSSLPTHLRQYVGPNRPAYIPRSVEQSLSRELQKNLPAHLSQYSGAYMQQRVIQPGLRREPVSVPSQRPPTPSSLRRDHNIPYGEQHTVELSSLPLAAKTRFESSSGRPTLPESLAPVDSTTTPPPADGPAHPPGYEFIMNPSQPTPTHRALPSLPGINPRLTKLIAVLAGLLVIVIIYGVLKSALSGPSNTAALVSVAQDQQVLVHLSNNAAQEPDISSSNQLFVATTALVFSSNNSQLVTYLSNNGHKLSLSQLKLKISTTTDQDLWSAETAGTFNQTFIQTIQKQINSYLSDLRSAYRLTKGPKGRALLNSQFNQAKLLEGQLSSANNG